MLVDALELVLSSNAPLQTLLGSPTSRTDSTTGIYPMLAIGQPTMPYVVFQQVTGDPLQESMQGTGRLHTGRWRFSCYGTTYRNAKLVAQALREAMISFFGYYAVQQVSIEGCWWKMEADDTEPLPKGTLYATHVDFEINYLDLH